MKIDFKIQKDSFGYYVVAYRILDGTEIQYSTCKSMGILLNFLEQDLKDFFHLEFGSDEKPKNNIMHFKEYDLAEKCVNAMRNLLPKGFETGNIFLTR